MFGLTKRKDLVWLVSLGASILFSSTCNAESAAVKRLQKSLDKERRRFDQSLQKAREGLLDGFAIQITKVQCNPVLPMVTKQALVATVQGERRAFAEKGTLPESDEMIWQTVYYVQRLRQSGEKLRRVYDLLAEQRAKEGDSVGSRRAISDRDKLFSRLMPRRKLMNGTKLHGSRHFDKAVTDFHLIVDQTNLNTFQGRVRQGRGAVELQVAGSMDGNRVTIQQTKTLRGARRNLNFSGFLISNRMVLWTGGTAKNGKPANDFVALR